MRLLLNLILGAFLISCIRQAPQVDFLPVIPTDITLCGPSPTASFVSFLEFSEKEDFEAMNHPRYLAAGEKNNLKKILPNDNLETAGVMEGNVLEVDLEVDWGDFRLETPNRPGLKMVAIGERKKSLTIPAPLLRVPEGTLIKANIKNLLSDSSITVFGLVPRPSSEDAGLFIEPGKTGKVEFKVGKRGTYQYWVRLGAGFSNRFGPEREQLAGAFIIDPPDYQAEDRVFVMNIFTEPVNLEKGIWMESLTMNGRSWPFAEIVKPKVGDSIRWHIINASNRNHPMHLHGFYFDIIERGSVLDSRAYSSDQIPHMVTDFMKRKETAVMEWVATRPGKWLYHCHLSFHVTDALRLPGAEVFDDPDAHPHMAGLVLGIDIPDGDSDLIFKGEKREITLHANEFVNEQYDRAAFDLKQTIAPKRFTPGPTVILKQFQPTYVTVQNNMSQSTSVHWHGLEIDSWSDGVPEWSSSDGKTSPMLYPGTSFTYKLSLMRAGTFIYHSHLDDVRQLKQGLYGPMIVLPEGEEYNPEKDHLYIYGWKRDEGEVNNAQELWDLNGWDEIPVQNAQVGETHRIRIMNIAPAGNVAIQMQKNGEVIPLRYIAKDGADLPVSQQIMVKKSQRYGVGETADFEFIPQKAGTYILDLKFWKQTWEVSP